MACVYVCLSLSVSLIFGEWVCVWAFVCGCVCDCLGDRGCAWVSVFCVCDSSSDSEYPRWLLWEHWHITCYCSPLYRITLYHYWTRHITMHVILGKPVKLLSRHGRGTRGWSGFGYWSSEGGVDVVSVPYVVVEPYRESCFGVFSAYSYTKVCGRRRCWTKSIMVSSLRKSRKSIYRNVFVPY